MATVRAAEVHHGLAAARATKLPLRAILGHWARELGIKGGLTVWPGPRNNPGNVTRAYVARPCGYLEGGSATERHNFPVFCSPADGVREYSWWMLNIRHYRHIAPTAAGDWRRACELIERSPWSSDHYGGTLDRTAAGLAVVLARPTVPVANLRTGPARRFPRHSSYPNGIRPPTVVALVSTVRGEAIAGSDVWLRVLVGPGNGTYGFLHSSVAERTLLPV